MSVKALTVRQPHASLISLRVKPIETRSWSTSYRGPLAIHAGLKGSLGDFGPYQATVQQSQPWLMCPDGSAVALPLGAIVAACELVDVLPIVGPEDSVLPAGSPCIVVDGTTLTWWEAPDYWHNEQDERDVSDQLLYGNFTVGCFAWLLDKIEPVDPPVPCRGYQGLWAPPDEVLAQIAGAPA